MKAFYLLIFPLLSMVKLGIENEVQLINPPKNN